LSDYPAENLQESEMEYIEGQVRAGAGLLMIGGWESFQGVAGGYHGTLIEELLPVSISAKDDRVNSADPCCVVPGVKHPVRDGLPFDSPPLVAGYNKFAAKPGTVEVLALRRFRTSFRAGDEVVFQAVATDPFLVTGIWGAGRTAALATDLAPHWVGGFVDWGPERKKLENGGREVEVGNLYLQFAGQLLRWTSSS
jgi:uncharacterized membrane protein